MKKLDEAIAGQMQQNVLVYYGVRDIFQAVIVTRLTVDGRVSYQRPDKTWEEMDVDVRQSPRYPDEVANDYL